MDRFIEKSCLYYELKHNNLKSNMDRFIDSDTFHNSFVKLEFKIQYG